MTESKEMVCWDISKPVDEQLHHIRDNYFNYMPIIDGSIDNIKGLLPIRKFATSLVSSNEVNEDMINGVMEDPIFIPEVATAVQLLDRFKVEKEEGVNSV